MAGYGFKFCFVICSLIFCNISDTKASKLNVPHVLLPLFQQFSTNFTLIASEGCYKWTSSRPDIVQVIPIDTDENQRCSFKAVISAITKEPIRNTVIILAEEVKTGFILRCDVIVDVIKSLKIITTTRELFVEEAPELFEVCAFDNQGNQFTTLESVEFQWNIENLAHSSTANQVLRFITFIDSSYETPPSVAKFDALGHRGHMVLIEGVKTGAAKVSVQLPQPEYNDVSRTEVVLTVVANLLLDPPDTHILVGDTVKFRLLQMQHGRLDEVSLPSPQYVLDIEDQNVAVIDSSVSVVRGLRLGQTRVVLRDRHSIADTETGAVKLPTATVFVTVPGYLRLLLLPHNNWAVLVNEPCSIQVQIFDRNNHRIHIGDAAYVRIVVSENYFQVYNQTHNGTVIDGETIKVGTVPVTATLESVRTIGGTEIKPEPVISAQEDMLIYPRLSVIPDSVIVPWDPTMPKYEIELTASGGDGSYNWRSNDISVATVSPLGIIKCHSLGETDIAVSMSRNPAIKAFSHVEVLPPSELQILKHVLEAPVFRPINLHIVLYADKVDENGNLERIPFTHCQQLPFKVEISNENFHQNITDVSKPIGKACATVALFGKVVGTSRVTVSYKIKNIVLEATTEVAAYSPLIVVHPVNKVTVLGLGTSRHLVWKGGPRVWLGRPAEHIRSIFADSTTGIQVEEINTTSPSELYVYTVICREIGEFKVALTVKNAAVNGNFKHTESVSTVKVICANPFSISFSPEISLNASCPYSTDSSRMVALNHEPIKIVVTITDAHGRVFDNATSYNFEWTLSTTSLGYIQYDGVVLLEDKKEYNYLVPLYHYQILYTKNRTGTLIIGAAIVSYKTSFLSYFKIVPETPLFWIKNEIGEKLTPEIKNTLSITLVNASIVIPDRATVFNHPNNKVLLKINYGSGFYKFYQSSTDIAEVQYHDSSNTIEVFPKSDGLLHLTIIDLCLIYKPPVAEIEILKVGSMQVDMVDRVQKGSSIIATVWLYDSVDNALAVTNSELLELRPLLESDLVFISRLPVDSPDGQIKFNITGLELGMTSITFTSGYGEREIRSQPQPLQVFSPLRIIPQDLTLVVGAVYQLTPTGGPQPDCAMEYSSSDPSIAKVSGAGLIEAQRIGETTVVGYAIGQYKFSKIVYSKDVVNIHVIPLEGVKIFSPLLRLEIGSRMPVWATGLPDKLTPLILGSIHPPLIFKWTASVPDIIELQDLFHATGVQVPDTDRLSMRVLALKPGRVTLHLKVTLRTARYGQISEFSDHLDIEIFEKLTLVKPVYYEDFTLLMAPFSHMHLRTNKDSVSEVTYNVIESLELSRNVQNTALAHSSAVISVSRSGLVTSFGTLGFATVLIHTTEDNGLKRTLRVIIEVKPIHYVMLNVRTRLHVGHNKVISALPRGLDVVFALSYHDNIGRTFSATRTDIRVKHNRYDCVKVAHGEVNGTLNTKLIGYGPTVLKVWDAGTPKVSRDYVKIRVDHLISPSKNEMVVGDVACFSMPLLDSLGNPGVWSSGAPDVVTMEAPTGIARAIAPGQALIRYSLNDTITTSTLVHVHPIHAIMFLPLNGRNLTNWGSFSVPLLLLSDHDLSDKTSNLLAPAPCPSSSLSLPPHHFPFACEIRFNSPMTPVDIHHVFHVEPSFNIQTGLYSCHFEAIGAMSPNTSVLTSNVTLRAISNNLVSEPLVIPFLPSVHLPSRELILTDRQAWAMLPVVGIPQVLGHVQVFSSDGSYLSVVEARKMDVNTLVYQVTVNALPPERQLHLYVFSPLTGQNVTVPVRMNLRSGLSSPCLAQPASMWNFNLEGLWGTTSTVISIIVIFLVVWYSSVFSWIRPGAQVPSFYATSTPVNATHIYQSTNGSPTPPFSEQRSFLYRQPFSDSEPVYGDPNLSTSPQMTRRRQR